jgi:hypothetical protein
MNEDFDPVLDLGFEPHERVSKPWLDGLEAHLDFISFLSSTSGHYSAGTMIWTLTEHRLKIALAEGRYDEARQSRETLRLLQERDVGMLAYAANAVKEVYGNAETLYVAPNFLELATVAANSLPDTTSFRASDLVAPKGFCYFARPMRHTFYTLEGGPGLEEASDPTTYVVRGIMWQPIAQTWTLRDGSPADDAYRLTWLVHNRDEQDEPEVFEESFGGDWRDIRWLPIYTHQVDETVVFAEPTAPLRWFMALNLLINQRVGYIRGVKPPRNLRRRGERASPNFGDLRVIHLRRRVPRNPHDDLGEQEEVNWSHRWVVRGHWRNQWRPKEGRHVPTWIAPFVKGPEDKPLIIKDRILSADR